MVAVLHGNLKDFGMADVLQLIGQQRKTGFLELEHEADHVRIGFDEGAVISASPVGELEFSALGESLVRSGLIRASDFDRTTAQSRASARPLVDLFLECDGLDEVILQEMMARLTQETLFQVMGWSSGAFHFSPSAGRQGPLVGEAFSVEKVLMDGLRMLDEWRTFPIEVQRLSSVFRSAKAAKRPAEADPSAGSEDSDRKAEVLRWLDGRRSIRQIVDGSRLTTFEVSRHLSEAYLSGQIEMIEEARERSRRFGKRSHSPWLRALRWGALSAWPVCFLACVVAVLSIDLNGDSSGPAMDTIGGPFAEAELQFARRRWAHLQEAGGLDSGLSGRVGGGADQEWTDPGGPLAPDALAAYSLRTRQTDFVPAAARH